MFFIGLTGLTVSPRSSSDVKSNPKLELLIACCQSPGWCRVPGLVAVVLPRTISARLLLFLHYMLGVMRGRDVNICDNYSHCPQCPQEVSVPLWALPVLRPVDSN